MAKENTRIYSSNKFRQPSFDATSANSEEMSDIQDDEYFLSNKPLIKRKSIMSCIGSIIGICITCYMLIITLLVALFLVIVLVIGYYGYSKAMGVEENVCISKKNNSPFYFDLNTGCDMYDSLPTSTWSKFFRNESQVTAKMIPSLDKEGKFISAWFYNGTMSEAPYKGKAVVMIHGIRVCKETSAVLIPAAMLHRNGYDVLTIDLRNHGGSFRDNYGMVSFGSLEHFDARSAIAWVKENIGLDTDSIGLFGSSMGASTGLITWARDRSIPAYFADSPPCDIVKVLEHNAEGALPPLSGRMIYWMMCQAAPLLTDYGCAPWPYDPLSSSMLNLTIGATNEKGEPIGEKLAFTRSIFFEHTDKDPIVPHDITQLCIDEVSKTATHVSSHVGNDPSPAPPIHPAGKRIPCDHHVKTMITDTDGYEDRIVTFFENHLKSS